LGSSLSALIFLRPEFTGHSQLENELPIPNAVPAMLQLIAKGSGD
jgi:hypothetical protein